MLSFRAYPRILPLVGCSGWERRPSEDTGDSHITVVTNVGRAAEMGCAPSMGVYLTLLRSRLSIGGIHLSNQVSSAHWPSLAHIVYIAGTIQDAGLTLTSPPILSSYVVANCTIRRTLKSQFKFDPSPFGRRIMIEGLAYALSFEAARQHCMGGPRALKFSAHANVRH